MKTQETTLIELATTERQICSCHAVMRQLRPHLDDEQKFLEQVLRQLKEGYYLAYLDDREGVKACAGFRFLEFLAWGKVLYLDDLVSDAAARKKGHATALLKWVLNRAKNAHCDQVHLDSGPHRHDAHRLYLNDGFKIIGYHFSLDTI